MDIFLNGLRQEFPRALRTLETWEQPDCVFELLERQTGESLDAAIHEFAKTRVWPPLTDDQKAMLGFRLDLAWHIAASLTEASADERMFPTSQLSDTEQLEWILIEAWFWPGSPFWESLARLAAGKEQAVIPEAFHGEAN